jgi:hypothetical protein
MLFRLVCDVCKVEYGSVRSFYNVHACLRLAQRSSWWCFDDKINSSPDILQYIYPAWPHRIQPNMKGVITKSRPVQNWKQQVSHLHSFFSFFSHLKFDGVRGGFAAARAVQFPVDLRQEGLGCSKRECSSFDVSV